MDEWIKKLWSEWVCVCVCGGTLFSCKKRKSRHRGCVARPWGHDAKWSKSDRKTQMPHALSYVWNPTLSNNKEQTCKYGEQIDGCQRQEVGEIGEGGEKVKQKPQYESQYASKFSYFLKSFYYL